MWRNYILAIRYSWHCSQRSGQWECVTLFLGSLLSLLVCTSGCMSISPYFNYCGFITDFEIRKYGALILIYSQISLLILPLFLYPVAVRIVLSVLVRGVLLAFLWEKMVHPYIALGSRGSHCFCLLVLHPKFKSPKHHHQTISNAKAKSLYWELTQVPQSVQSSRGSYDSNNRNSTEETLRGEKRDFK